MKKFRTENPEKWKAEQKVSNFLRNNKDLKPKESIISGEKGIIHLHHPDYTKPNEVIPCTPREHRAIHAGKIEEKKEYIITLPF
jgi:hypothetical protein